MRLDANGAQLLDRMLGRFCLEFSSSWDVGQKCQMNIDRMAARQIIAELADRLKKRQALNVAYRAANFDQHKIDPVIAFQHKFFDVICNVRNDLHGRAQIIAAPLSGYNILIDTSRGNIILPVGGAPCKALVMAKIKISLRPVISNENFAMLRRAHRARIYIEVGIKFTQAYCITASLKQGAKSCRRKPLAQRGHHAAGDENIASHGIWELSGFNRFGERIFAPRQLYTGQLPGAGNTGPYAIAIIGFLAPRALPVQRAPARFWSPCPDRPAHWHRCPRRADRRASRDQRER